MRFCSRIKLITTVPINVYYGRRSPSVDWDIWRTTLDTNDRRPTESFDTAPFCSDFATLKLDQNNYVNGEMMNITLSDRNAKAPVKVTVKSSNHEG